MKGSTVALAPHDEHWHHELLDSLALIDGEIHDLRNRDEPGDRWRVADLMIRRDDRRKQLARLAR